MPADVALVWLRHDLRLDDHEAFVRAATADRLVPLYVFDPRYWAETPWGFGRRGPHATQFLLDTLAALREALRRLGSDLVVRTGRPEDVVPALVRETGTTRVLWHSEPMRDERDAEAAVADALHDAHATGTGVALWRGSTHTLLHPHDLPYRLADVPDGFTRFRLSVEGRVPVRPCLDAPTALPPPPDGLAGTGAGALPTLAAFGLEAPAPEPRAVLAFRGGEAEGRARLRHYTGAAGDADDEPDGAAPLGHYADTRNALLGADGSSKLSPWLAVGALSPRRVYHATRRYAAAHPGTPSPEKFVFELYWRDFFRFYAARHGNRLFFSGGPRHGRRAWRWDAGAFAAWTAGQTGIPLVDATMRELACTGWTSNRGRQNAASVFAKTLGLDWRAGAAWFERMLLDHDVTTNWGNWAYVAGVGADPRDRVFNPVRQGHAYDPGARYLTAWLPELASLPPALAIAPWTLSALDEGLYGVRLGHDYPRPLVALDGNGVLLGRERPGKAPGRP